jgi:hypothetical protein
MKVAEGGPLSGEGVPRFLSTLELVVNKHAAQRTRDDGPIPSMPGHAPATIVGRLYGFTDAGVPLVEFAGQEGPEAVPARTTVALHREQIGSEVVLTFASGDQRQPIILGCLVAPAALPVEAEAPPTHVELNGQRLEFTAQEEIVLRCGKASITLTRAGKVLIRGEYLLSRSAGVNRIKGGSVQIN